MANTTRDAPPPMAGPPQTPAPRITTTWPGRMRPSLSAAMASSLVQKQIAGPVKRRSLRWAMPGLVRPDSGARLPRSSTMAGCDATGLRDGTNHVRIGHGEAAQVVGDACRR